MLTVLHIAWSNSTFNLKRTLAALGGITFSILLIFLQLGFLQAAKKEVVLLYDYLDFDIAITANEYQFLANSPPFDRNRLFQAAVDPAIMSNFALNLRTGEWLDPKTDTSSSLLLIGLDDKPEFIRDPELLAGLATLSGNRSVILDRFSHRDYGERAIGQSAYVNRRDVTVSGLFQLGLFFFAEGAAVTSNPNFVRMSGRKSQEVTVGLLRLKPGENPETVAARLRGLLPDDVVVLTRAQLIQQEQDYFVTVKPVGIMFQSAVFVAFVVGLVILFQVMATEITSRMTEFATMKAMGFGPGFVYGLGIAQNLMFILVSFFPAVLAAMGVFQLVYRVSKMPTEMTSELLLTVLGLSLTMCVVAGFLALRKVGHADPADLY